MFKDIYVKCFYFIYRTVPIFRSAPCHLNISLTPTTKLGDSEPEFYCGQIEL